MIRTKTLENGVRLVVEKMDQVESVALGIYVRNGAVNEDAKYAGISHFIEHMMFKGTETRTAREIAHAVDRVGGQINAFTGKESTCYYVRTTKEHVKTGAEVLCDMLENSLFAKEELDKERGVIIEEINMNKDTPDDVAHENLMSIMFAGKPASNSILGTPTSLKRITHNVMAEYVANAYVRNDIVISAAGNVDINKLARFFSRKFEGFKKSKKKAASSKGELKIGSKVEVKDITQSHICLGTKGIPIDHKDVYALQILNNAFGGSMSSRLFQNIREQKGLAYSVFSNIGGFTDTGYLEIYAGVGHDGITKALDGIREELESLAKSGLTEDELEASREQMKSLYVFSQENPAARMLVNGRNYLLRGKIDSPKEVLDGYNRVDAADINRLARKITDFSKYSCSVVSDHKYNLSKYMRSAR